MSSERLSRQMDEREAWLARWNDSKLTDFDRAASEPGSDECRSLILNDVHIDLELARFAPLVDATDAPTIVSNGQPCVVFYSQAGGMRMSHIQEGGRQSPGNVLLVICPTWLSKRDGKVFCTQGISMDQYQRTTMRRYHPPRLVTYFVNMMNFATTNGWRNDGVQFTESVETPLSSSEALSNAIGDKLNVGVLLGCTTSVRVPVTLAFMYRPLLEYAKSSEVRVLTLDSLDLDAAYYEREVASFLAAQQPRIARVVVKPTGVSFHQSFGVSFHWSNEVSQIAAALRGLSDHLKAGDGMLVEEYLQACPSKTTMNDFDRMLVDNTREQLGPDATSVGQLRAHRLRVIVARTADDRAVAAPPVCGIGMAGVPIGGHNTFAVTFDVFCDLSDIPQGDLRERLRSDIRRTGADSLMALIRAEPKWRSADSPRSQTDNIGLDVILGVATDGTISPAVIEINDHDCTAFSQELSSGLSKYNGIFVRTWITNGLHRSVRYLLSKRTIAIIGNLDIHHSTLPRLLAGHLHGLSIVHIVSVCSSPEQLAALQAGDAYVQVLVRDVCDAKEIIEALKASNRTVDGVLAAREDTVAVTADLSHQMGLFERTGDPASLKRATRALVRTAFLKRMADMLAVSINHVTNPGEVAPLYTVAVKDRSELVLLVGDADARARLTKAERKADLEVKIHGANATVVSLPAVLKLDNTSNDPQCTLITSLKDLDDRKQEVSEILARATATNSAVLEAYAYGSEHGVAIVLFDAKTLGSVVIDYGSGIYPNLPAASAQMPSLLSDEAQERMTSLASDLLFHLGLRNGVYFLKFRHSTRAPSLTSLRMVPWSSWLCDWVRLTTGYDLTVAALAVAAGIHPPPFIVNTQKEPLCFIKGIIVSDQEARDIPSTVDDAILTVARAPASHAAIVYTHSASAYDAHASLTTALRTLGLTDLAQRAQ